MLSIICGCLNPVGTSVANIPAAPDDVGRIPVGGRLSAESRAPGPAIAGSLPPDAGREPDSSAERDDQNRKTKRHGKKKECSDIGQQASAE